MRGLNETLQQIRRGLASERIRAAISSQVNMRSGEVIGVEALIRWQHPEKGLLPPLEFLPLIEDHPLAVELGEWVIDTALRHRERLAENRTSICRSASIIGARQLQQANFVERLEEILAAHPTFAPGCIEMEVLETSAPRRSGAGVTHHRSVPRDRRRSFARRLLGTGYSSLTHPPCPRSRSSRSIRALCATCSTTWIDLAIPAVCSTTAFRRSRSPRVWKPSSTGDVAATWLCDIAPGYGIAARCLLPTCRLMELAA